MKKTTRNLLLAAFLAASTAISSHAHAQANFTFSGGSGAVLILTLNAPVNYTITSSSAFPFFDFPGMDSTGVNYFDDVSFLTYSVNGVGSYSLSSVDSGFSFNNIGPSDIWTFGYPYSLGVGDIVTLNPGNTLTNDTVGVAAPASGDYTTFIMDGSGSVVSSTNGVSAAPEPGTWAMLALGGIGMVGLRRLRRRQSA